MPVSALAHLPAWRAVLLTATTEPAVIELTPWWNTEHAGAVQDSLTANSPAGPAAVLAPDADRTNPGRRRRR